ncbi:MAG: 4Fe-4S binding protein [Pseudomonadota bacterium]
MKRKIIEIDEALCTGCGLCVTSCEEGALRVIEGKARVVKDDFCDGLGACIGECPEGALRIVEREAPAFDPAAVAVHLGALGGAPHTPAEPLACGCPGSAVKVQQPSRTTPAVSGAGLPAQLNPSDLAQWPVQLHLVPVRAPFFHGKELVVLSTCGPVASADIHWRFLRGRSVVVACPKLDRTDPYVEKLASIFASNAIPRVIVVRMEVPCCGGLTALVHQAMLRSHRADLVVDEVVLGSHGPVLSERRLHG